MPRGGKRPNAGRKRGAKIPRTRIKEAIQAKRETEIADAIESKEAARDAFRAQVFAQLHPLIDAQIKHALGLKYLVVREKKTGKFLKVTKERMDALLANPEDDPELELLEVWDKDPSVQAFTDLMNRTLDKPKEQVDVNVTGELEVVTKTLQAARKRLAQSR